MIKPEIGKLPKSIVDRIPLVVYIPPPPDELTGGPRIPEAIYANTYPPKPRATTPPKRRFAFLKKLKGKSNGENGETSDAGKKAGKKAQKDGEPLTWEENWEAGEYPFVRLEGNRAACAICLMDFEEPKRVGGKPDDADATPAAHDQAVAEGPAQEVPIQEETRDVDAALKLEDAGEGAQPLRLLACGHVFHVSVQSRGF